jgi:hypothetical protein
MNRIGRNLLPLAVPAILALGACDGDSSEAVPTTYGTVPIAEIVTDETFESSPIQGQLYPAGRQLLEAAQVQMHDCLLISPSLQNPGDTSQQEIMQFRSLPLEDGSTDMVRMVYVEPVSAADRGNLDAMHEYWFSGSRSLGMLGLGEDGQRLADDSTGYSLIDCPPVGDPLTHSQAGGYVDAEGTTVGPVITAGN